MAESGEDDPCAAYAALNATYLKIISGQTVKSVAHGNLSTEYSPANIRAMQDRLRLLYAECQASQGRSRRRAFTGG